MKKLRFVGLALFVFVLSVAMFAGCRRMDVRTMTVEFEALSKTNETMVVKVLSKYDGVAMDSFCWDYTAKTLTLDYDSMKIAQANIRYAIDEVGIKVKFPEKTDDHAGH